MLEQLNVFSDSDVDAAAEALNDVSDPPVNMVAKSNNKGTKITTSENATIYRENHLYFVPRGSFNFVLSNKKMQVIMVLKKDHPMFELLLTNAIYNTSGILARLKTY